MKEGTVMAVRVHNEEGDLVHVELDKHWTEEESEHVLTVHVKRYTGDGGTPLGRIDTREHVYNVRHQELADFVHWKTHTVTLGLEELILAGQHDVTEVHYFDERNRKRYTISLEMLRQGHIERREKIGWRWITPLEWWTVRRST
jgi:hypothetical protein